MALSALTVIILAIAPSMLVKAEGAFSSLLAKASRKWSFSGRSSAWQRPSESHIRSETCVSASRSTPTLPGSYFESERERRERRDRKKDESQKQAGERKKIEGRKDCKQVEVTPKPLEPRQPSQDPPRWSRPPGSPPPRATVARFPAGISAFNEPRRRNSAPPTFGPQPVSSASASSRKPSPSYSYPSRPNWNPLYTSYPYKWSVLPEPYSSKSAEPATPPAPLSKEADSKEADSKEVDKDSQRFANNEDASTEAAQPSTSEDQPSAGPSACPTPSSQPDLDLPKPDLDLDAASSSGDGLDNVSALDAPDTPASSVTYEPIAIDKDSCGHHSPLKGNTQKEAEAGGDWSSEASEESEAMNVCDESLFSDRLSDDAEEGEVEDLRDNFGRLRVQDPMDLDPVYWWQVAVRSTPPPSFEHLPPASSSHEAAGHPQLDLSGLQLSQEAQRIAGWQTGCSSSPPSGALPQAWSAAQSLPTTPVTRRQQFGDGMWMRAGQSLPLRSASRDPWLECPLSAGI